MPLLLPLFLGCGASYTESAEEARPITPTPPSTPVSPSGAAQQQFIRSVLEYDPPVKQASVKPRGRDIYAEIVVEQDVDPTEAEAVLDHALETMEDSLSSESGWFNYHIRVLRPDGSDVVSVAEDAPQMFEDRRQGVTPASAREAPVRHLPDVEATITPCMRRTPGHAEKVGGGRVEAAVHAHPGQRIAKQETGIELELGQIPGT